MSYIGTLYEGDSVIHRMPLRTETLDEDSDGMLSWSTLWQRVAAACGSFFDWVGECSQQARYRQIEAYLSEASDLADLEHRQLELERHHSHFIC